MVTLLVSTGPRASASFIRPSVPGDPGVGRRAAETKNQKPGAQKPGAQKPGARGRERSEAEARGHIQEIRA